MEGIYLESSAVLYIIRIAPLALMTVVYFCRLASNYGALPQRLATHFGMNGAADSWMTPLAWTLLSAGALGLQLAILMVITLATPQSVAQFSIPILFFTFGTVYSAFNQVLSIGLHQRVTISTAALMLYGVTFGILGVGAGLFRLSTPIR